MEDHREDRWGDPRTDRLGVLLDQFDFARETARARLDGLVSPASLCRGLGVDLRRTAPAARAAGRLQPSATVALERFWAALDRWRDSVAAVTDEQLDTVGFDQYPWSDAAEMPFITVLWAANFEFIHHMAEIALLRDLYRTRSM